MLKAVDLNRSESKQRSAITCIEPYPRPEFRTIDSINHIEAMCQAVPWEVFEQLETGDLLFIDSSHTLKTGSDVARIYLDVLPSLNPGVVVHIHDVFLPYLYSRSALQEWFGWQETSLLLALLTGNDNLGVLSCLSALHYDRSPDLKSILRDYEPQQNDAGLSTGVDPEAHFPSSMWLRTVSPP